MTNETTEVTSDSTKRKSFLSLSTASLPASFVDSAKYTAATVTSGVVKTTIGNIASAVKLPDSSFNGMAGLYVIAFGNFFKGAYTACSRYRYGKEIFTGFSIALLLGLTPFVGASTVLAISAAQFANTVIEKGLNEYCTKEKSLDPAKAGDDVLNGKVWIYCNGVGCAAQIAANALLPLTTSLVAPVGLFTSIVASGVAERFILRKVMSEDKSTVKDVIRSESTAKAALAVNAIMISLSSMNTNGLVSNLCIESNKYLTHIICFRKRNKADEFVSKCIDSALKVKETVAAHNFEAEKTCVVSQWSSRERSMQPKACMMAM